MNSDRNLLWLRRKGGGGGCCWIRQGPLPAGLELQGGEESNSRQEEEQCKGPRTVTASAWQSGVSESAPARPCRRHQRQEAGSPPGADAAPGAARSLTLSPELRQPGGLRRVSEGLETGRGKRDRLVTRPS